ncbi:MULTISPECIES: metal-dependent transcriptional regulator [unclassified Actinopolyspora]|uniref:metal-dependent transcriptional regulator n=1 Tax=Actinopolyspora TaxID=1849 RepID=UPI0013F659EB|nr:MULTISPECIES: metal-dependent transcriptional regulator [unclassified Actinopolyspora]NHD17232.1 metal-dependent transcriptional regulator [Actinopolyspora sp. BKK2]NHE76384.1 metal-dependent transcriptional regulator [Actinopolyspora sp. BKK1]
MTGTVERHSASVEDYVRTIYGLSERGSSVTNTTLTSRLGLSPSSVSGMITKLAQLGLVTHERYRSVELTTTGRRLACDVLRRHRLLEQFLVEVLDYTWDEVHQEADALEHAVSDELIEHIASKLGHPTHDPHGDPIPTAEGVVEKPTTKLLDQLAPGTVGTIARVWDTDSELLRYLTDHGMTLGNRIEVVERKPFGGPLVVRVGSAEEAETHFLGSEIAQTLSITVQH